MHATGKLGRKRCVNHSVTINPIFPAKRFSHDGDTEMGLASRPMTGMAGMLMGFVDHGEVLWRESLSQLIRDVISNRHGHCVRRLH